MLNGMKTLNLLAPGVDEEEMAKKADLVDGKVPASELPSYVDDAVEYDSVAEFPNPGEQGKIYVAIDSGFTYRWSGSDYVQIGGQDLSEYYTKDETDELLEEKQPVGDYATNTALAEGLATKQPVGDYATNTALVEGLAEKQDKGDYATNTALEEGLAGKQDVGDYATNATLEEGLAGKQDVGDYATNSALEAGLATKQPVGDYATNTALTEGLAAKQDAGDYATSAELTAGLATKQPVGDYATSAALTAGLAAKQDVVADLDTIRSGAALGATAVQPTDVSPIPELDVHRLFRTEYSITTSITNGTYSGDNSIWTEETAAVTLVANTDYSLPETIVVSGAAYIYDDTTGAISLSAATGDVSISAECDPVVPPTPGDMPNKGDIITLNGESQRYRVLKVTGNVAQLMHLGNHQRSAFSRGGETKTFDNGSTGLKYEGSTLDSLLNTTYYNSLSSNIKNAIVEESRIQNMYRRADGSSISADFRMQRDNGNWYSYTKTDQTAVGQRNVYALDVSDIAEYLGTDIVYTDLLNMFFEQTTTVSRYVWTSSAYASNSGSAWFVYGSFGYLYGDYCSGSCEVFPAFSINLSLIDWSAA